MDIILELKKILRLNHHTFSDTSHLSSQLKVSWISGIIYFIIGIAEVAFEYYRFVQLEEVSNNFTYITIKVALFIVLAIFLRGFMILGKMYQNDVLKITSLYFIVVTALFYTYDIISLYHKSYLYEIVIGAQSAAFGVIGILFAIGIYTLKKHSVYLASITGIFALLTYGCLLTIVLAPIGFILFKPTLILEIIMLYSVAKTCKDKSTS